MGASKRRIGERAGACRRRGRAGLWSGVGAAETTTVLPEINVTNTRLVGGARGARRGVAPGTGADAGDRGARGQPPAPSGIVTGTIITGASSTVITAQEIERSPGHDPAGHAGARAGHPGDQPVRQRERRRSTRRHARLRRRRHVQHAGADQRPPAQRHRHGGRRSSAPSRKNSIERIEITRGNSGAVLYGDGAVGGVINIVTKNARRPAAVGARAGGLRLVQLPGGQSSPRTASHRGRSRRRCTPTRSAPTAIARTTSCARRTRSAISAGPTAGIPAPISTSPPTTSISGCRAAGA